MTPEGGRDRGPKVVALGGGHGLYATLSALRTLHEQGKVSEITAVVTVADNGGSSGRLRQDYGVLPPGDLRMALAALCGTDEWGQTWAEVFQHRFAGDGDLQGHALGNLLIVGLWERLGSHVQALEWAGRLLGAKGRVLPMACSPLDIVAQVRESVDAEAVEVRGQVQVAKAPGEIVRLSLDPADPDPCVEALDAIRDADLVLLGPGSWYTSVLPHLLVDDVRTALQETTARRGVLLNLVPQAGETTGFTPQDHLRVLHEHAPGLVVDHVLADRHSVSDVPELSRAVAWLGGELVMADLRVGEDPHHDHDLLVTALEHLVAPPRTGLGAGRASA
ncbi:gluconeogenesis factor YvcK family protein [Nocardioides yefusunii]|uniref:Putative gluconeogenesis factor n=1 Tax=Nocardioides yefusunii TaxID=2500546 RepID=A0ABW1R2P2_9ACTN